MEVVAYLFNDIIQLRGGVPETWRKTRLRVLFKKGNVQCPDNYRPISILPILLKLFSRVIYARISNTLNAGQSVDQAGFRANYGCDDHLFTITMLKEKCEEFGTSLWVATVDYRKAFDTVEHAAIWTALAKQGVAQRYIKVLQLLYEGQTANIVANSVSRLFNLARGAKQGDPISPPLFNAVLEGALETVKKQWLEKGWGIPIGKKK